jgi:hypothetical protein
LAHAFNRKEIQLNCADGSLELLVWGDLPHNIRTSLARNIRTALAVEGRHPLEAMDSSKTPGVHCFETIHFDYYVRNATQVSVFLSKLLPYFYTYFIRVTMHLSVCIPTFFIVKEHLKPTTTS